jgi:hypothetical protein
MLVECVLLLEGVLAMNTGVLLLECVLSTNTGSGSQGAGGVLLLCSLTRMCSLTVFSQSTLAVGLGVLAGSTVMLLTVLITS